MSEEFENENLIDLFDEDGTKVTFEHLDTIRIEDTDYIVCIPYDEEEEEVTEIAMFQIDKDENSEDCLTQVFEDALAEQIYAEFKSRNADLFDFED